MKNSAKDTVKKTIASAAKSATKKKSPAPAGDDTVVAKKATGKASSEVETINAASKKDAPAAEAKAVSGDAKSAKSAPAKKAAVAVEPEPVVKSAPLGSRKGRKLAKVAGDAEKNAPPPPPAPVKAAEPANAKPAKSKSAASKPAAASAPKRSVARQTEPTPLVEQEYLDDRSYSRSHVWVLVEDTPADLHYAKVGITDYLLDELGNIEDLDMPLVRDELEIDDAVILIHTGTRRKHVRCPLTGRVLELNQEVLDEPTLLFKDYRENWLFRMEFDDLDELDLLMSGLQYARFLDERER